MNSRKRDLVKELAGEVCRCGAPKLTGRTFCRKCYFSLPAKLRAALYQRLGQGYEQAYDEALAFWARKEMDNERI